MPARKRSRLEQRSNVGTESDRDVRLPTPEPSDERRIGAERRSSAENLPSSTSTTHPTQPKLGVPRLAGLYRFTSAAAADRDGTMRSSLNDLPEDMLHHIATYMHLFELFSLRMLSPALRGVFGGVEWKWLRIHRSASVSVKTQPWLLVDVDSLNEARCDGHGKTSSMIAATERHATRYAACVSHAWDDFHHCITAPLVTPLRRRC